MYDPRYRISWVTAAVAALGLSLVPHGAFAENAAPALAAFEQAFASVNDYAVVERVHEVKGTASQNRTYEVWFMKPHFAKTLIQAGDGKGSGGVWAGGDQVSGHQGGLFSGLHLKVSLHDPRAVSLRGITIPEGLIQNVVHRYATTAGTLSQAPGGKIGGVSTDRLDLKVANPAGNDGVSEQILYLSQETHWPIRQILYAGDQIVLDESITDLKTNTGLTQSDFPF
jgi:outer membrane lipoprotein-sorting protein